MAGITVRDVTQRVVDELNNSVPGGAPPNQATRTLLLPNNAGCFRDPVFNDDLGCGSLWPVKWNRPQLTEYSYVDDPPVDGQGKLRVTSRTISPRTLEWVLEIEGEYRLGNRLQKISTPKLVAVSWPTALLPGRSTAVPFLVYFRPEPIPGPDRFGPFFVAPNLKPYPWGWDFLFYGFWNFLNYRADPLTYKDERWRLGKSAQRAFGIKETDEKFTFGLPYQIRASGKPLVLILPLPGPHTFGEFRNPEAVLRMLEAIQGFVHNRAGIPPPALDWVALAGFSKSNRTVSNLLRTDHPFPKNIVREVYLFDPPADSDNDHQGNESILAAKAWAERTSVLTARGAALKAIRLYTTTRFFAVRDLIGENLPNGAFFRESRLSVQIGNTGLVQNVPWSAGHIPLSTWREGAAAARVLEFQHSRAQLDRDFVRIRSLPQVADWFRGQFALQEQEEYDKVNFLGVNPNHSGGDQHLALAAMLLTDAVRRNGFNYALLAPGLRRTATQAGVMVRSQ
jgi:hypothetical protein